MLIVVDHATGSDQVLPLLPDSTEALVLITSRRMTAQTQAVPLTLEILEAGEAAKLFTLLAGRPAWTKITRVSPRSSGYADTCPRPSR
jgi:hypothetical protein